MSAASRLPSAQEIARALGGHVRRGGDIAFPGPRRKPADRSCTLRVDAKAPNGFVVADARGKIPGLELKDHVCSMLGLEAFKPKHKSGNGSAARSGKNQEVRDLSTKDGRNGGGGGSTVSPRASGGRIRLHHLKDIQLSTRRRDLVTRLIPRVGLTVVYGPPKSGKSFFVMDIAASVAFGRECHGRRVEQGPAIYCYLEGQSAASVRIEAIRQHYRNDNTESAPFYLMPVTIDLVAEHLDLIAAIKNALGAMRPHVIVIDTLNRSFSGSESSDLDMTNYIKALDAIRDAFECAVIVVHHCGHEASRPRGHSALAGATEAVIGVKKESAGQFIATVDMMKDGPEGDVIAGRLDPINVGHDEDGEVIRSCVVVPIEAPARKASIKPPKLYKSDATALKALRRALDEKGEPPPASGTIPHNTKVVPRGVWRDYAFKFGISGSDEDRAMRKAFSSSFERLIANSRVGYEEPFAWII
jgi:hypothetical protein